MGRVNVLGAWVPPHPIRPAGAGGGGGLLLASGIAIRRYDLAYRVVLTVYHYYASLHHGRLMVVVVVVVVVVGQLVTGGRSLHCGHIAPCI